MTQADLENAVTEAKAAWHRSLHISRPPDAQFERWLKYHTVEQCRSAFEYVLVANHLGEKS